MKSKITAISKFGIKVENNDNWLNARSFKVLELLPTLKKGDVVDFDFAIVNIKGTDKYQLKHLIKINPSSSIVTPTKEAKQGIGYYPCKVCNHNFTDKKTSMFCEQNHYLKDIADTLRARFWTAQSQTATMDGIA